MTDSGRIKTLIFEDENFDLKAILSILQEIPEIEFIGRYDTIAMGIEQCKLRRPDLIIVDASIRGDKTAGPIFVRNVLRVLPKVRILGLTRYPECISSLKSAGCHEAILKQFFDDPDAAKKFIRDTMLQRPEHYISQAPHVLSEQQDKVLRMLACGKTEADIEKALEVTRRQLRDITDDLKQEFGVQSNKNTELVARAYQAGYLKPEDDLDQEFD